MKNLLQLLSFVLIIALFGACTSTSNLTYCPDFNKKNKTPKNLVLNFKKKQNKKQKAIVKKTKSIENEIQQAKSVEPLQSISQITISNSSSNLHELTALNAINLNHFLTEKLATKINEHFDVESATASLKTIIEKNNTGTLENLGVAKFVEAHATKPLSKKQIKKIERKVAKFEQKLEKLSEKENALHQDGSPKKKSQLTALLLAIFAGAIGIHRFYLGYTGIGIAQIFTLGGCGVWTLIDVINIVTGNLGPADGSEYDPDTTL